MKVQTLVTEFSRHVISLSFLSTAEFQNAVLLTEAPSSIISLLFLRLLFFYIGTCDAAGSRMVRWYRFGNSCESPAVLALSRLSDYLWTWSVHHVFLCVSSPCFVTVCCFFLSVSTSYIYLSIFIKTGVVVVVIFVKYVFKNNWKSKDIFVFLLL